MMILRALLWVGLGLGLGWFGGWGAVRWGAVTSMFQFKPDKKVVRANCLLHVIKREFQRNGSLLIPKRAHPHIPMALRLQPPTSADQRCPL